VERIPWVQNFLTIRRVTGIDSLKNFVDNEAFTNAAVAIEELDVIVRFADPLKLVRMAVVVWTILLTDEQNRDIRPILS
jgi:trehalose/maltose hydrolase-like predicted phosphorylase